MGWWKVAEDVVIGDDPADAMSRFVAALRKAMPGVSPEEAWERIYRAVEGEKAFPPELQKVWEEVEDDILYSYAEEFEGREPSVTEWRALVFFVW